MRFAITAGLLLILLCGCAIKPFVLPDSSRFAETGTAYEGQATVYVMRDISGAGMAWPINIKLDGTQKGSLRRETYIHFPVHPGRHIIDGHWNSLSGLPNVALSVDLEAGK